MTIECVMLLYNDNDRLYTNVNNNILYDEGGIGPRPVRNTNSNNYNDNSRLYNNNANNTIIIYY